MAAAEREKREREAPGTALQGSPLPNPLTLPPLPGAQVNLKLFAPEPGRRRTVLLFVIRDKSRATPLAKVTETLEADVTRMWASISKPPKYRRARPRLPPLYRRGGGGGGWRCRPQQAGTAPPLHASPRAPAEPSSAVLSR